MNAKQSKNFAHPFIVFALVLICFSQLDSAEYQGQNIDGITYDATAYSYDTGNYYNVQVEFDADQVTIRFSNGGHIDLTLDDEEIEDPHSISAYDYQRSVYWELDVDGLD